MNRMPVMPPTLERIVEAGGSVEADAMFPDRMMEIAKAAARSPHKPRVTFRIVDLYNPQLLADIARAGDGCVTFVFPPD